MWPQSSFNYYKHRWLNLSPQHANWTLHVDDATTNWLALWRKSPQDMIDRPKWCPVVVEHLRICNTCTKRLEFSRVSVLSRQVWSGWICSKFCCHRHCHQGYSTWNGATEVNGGIIFIKLEPEWLEPKEILYPSYYCICSINFNYRSPCDNEQSVNLWCWSLIHIT